MFNNLEDDDKQDQRLSILEKTVILSLTLLAKAAIRKIIKAKTYGDINKIIKFIDTKVENMGDGTGEFEEKNEKEQNVIVQDLTDSITDTIKGIKNL